ncbi:MAG: exodeoxyribonuclease VII small subunit [Okeania sp. SIO2D1]|nr:exodeoxyribonuclease VII small subunit [Okeania sp. SIO2D1]
MSDRPNYENTVNNIESIIAQIESGSLTLEEIFGQFSLAVEQLQQCEQFLTHRREQMELLIETLENEAD